MNIDEQEWSLQAAEYVLGSLDEHDTRVFDQLYQVDEEWRRQVHYWRKLLDPLNASTAPVEAPRRVLEAVLLRISEEKTSSSTALVKVPTPNKTSAPQLRLSSQTDAPLSRSVRSTINTYKERVRYWQLATTVAVMSAIAALFLTPRYLEQRNVQGEEVRTVAVLQSEANDLLWAIAYPSQEGDAATVISITVVGEPQLDSDQNHQLWMVLPDDGGVRSVGLLPDTLGQTMVLTLPEELDAAQEFAVSLEALGGVEGPEHGPVVARTFIIRAPADET